MAHGRMECIAPNASESRAVEVRFRCIRSDAFRESMRAGMVQNPALLRDRSGDRRDEANAVKWPVRAVSAVV